MTTLKEKINIIVGGIVIVLILLAMVSINISCWNVPLAQRTGFCAMLHQ